MLNVSLGALGMQKNGNKGLQCHNVPSDPGGPKESQESLLFHEVLQCHSGPLVPCSPTVHNWPLGSMRPGTIRMAPLCHGAQALALCIPETHPGLLSIRKAFPLFVLTCLQCLHCSALTGAWRHLFSCDPQWDPLKL